MDSLYEHRFMSKRERLEALVEAVPFSGCWIFLGAVDTPPRLPYGKFWEKETGRSIAAHRSAWVIYKGAIPTGMKVLHRCDVPACVNPDHLFLGTPKENTQDMMRKNRDATCRESRRGINSNFSKLTPNQVTEIFYMPGFQKDIAKRYGVTQTSVSLIKRGINWRHLTEQLHG